MGKTHNRSEQTEIIILLVGLSGTGKSSFINHLRDNTSRSGRVFVSNSSTVGTTSIQTLHTESRDLKTGGRLVVIDTPGLDSGPTAMTVRKDILVKVKEICRRKKKLAAIFYFYDIRTNSRLPASATAQELENLVSSLRGHEKIKTFLVTTKWSSSTSNDRDIQEAREEELKTNHWKSLLDKSGEYDLKRFEFTQDSAWSVVDKLLDARS